MAEATLAEEREQAALVFVLEGQLDLVDHLRAARVCRSWSRAVATLFGRLKGATPRVDGEHTRSPWLVALDLSAHFALRDPTTALQLLRRMPCVVALNLGYVRPSPAVPLSLLVTAFNPELRHLDLSALAAKKSVNDAAVDALTQRCRLLTRLNLFGCWLITDLALKAVGERCPGLQYLNVGSCMSVTDVGVGFIAQGCPSLLDLNLWRLDQVSDKSLALVAERCPQISVLVVSDTKFITHAGLKRFTCKVYW